MTADTSNNYAFRRHHMGRLLGRIGSMLPQWLDGTELAHAARDIERMCWRELGYRKAPLFPGDVPPFLLRDQNGLPTEEPLQDPMLPKELAAHLAALGAVENQFQQIRAMVQYTNEHSMGTDRRAMGQDGTSLPWQAK